MPDISSLKPVEYFDMLMKAGQEGEALKFAQAVKVYMQSQPEKPKKKGGIRMKDVLSSVAEGMSLGFSDELLAAGGRFFNDPEAGQVAARAQAGREQFQKEHPVLGTAAELAPAALTGAGLARGVGTLGGRLVSGAAIGGLAGAGKADGGLQERLPAAGVGAAAGAAVGALAPAVAGRIAGSLRRLNPAGRARFQLKEIRGVERDLSKKGIILPQELAEAKAKIAALYPDKPQTAQRLAQAIDDWAERGYKGKAQKKPGWLSRLAKKGVSAAKAATPVPSFAMRAMEQVAKTAQRPPAPPIFGRQPLDPAMAPELQGLIGRTLPPMAGLELGGLLGQR